MQSFTGSPWKMSEKFSTQSKIPKKTNNSFFDSDTFLKRICHAWIGVLKQVVTSTDTHPNALSIVQLDV